MCASSLFLWVPYVCIVAAALYLSCWVVFWFKIASFRNELSRHDAEFDEELPPELR
jgi:hypothetical protein